MVTMFVHWMSTEIHLSPDHGTGHSFGKRSEWPELIKVGIVRQECGEAVGRQNILDETHCIGMDCARIE